MKTVNQYQRIRPSFGTTSVALLAVTLGLAGLAGLAGCEREGPAETAGKEIDQTAEKAGSSFEDTTQSVSEMVDEAGDYIADTAITARIDAAILGDPSLKVLQIGVTTNDGVVTLSGVVDSQQSIDRARQIAGDVDGVKSVDNALVVR